MARYLISHYLQILWVFAGFCWFYSQYVGSFIEFLPILVRLQSKYTPQDLPYHVIVPSLPGFAFSDSPPLDKNFSLHDVARIFNRLMFSLGFGDGYVVQGGDIGSKTARIMAIGYPSCKGGQLHSETNEQRC